jgi:hypothetical protein
MARVIRNKAIGRTYELNDETKLLLSDFMRGGRKANMPNSKNWARCVSEIHYPNNTISWNGIPQYNGGDDMLIVVRGFDIYALLRLIYGSDMVTMTNHSVDGKEVNIHATAFYAIQYIKTNVKGLPVFVVTQADKEAVERESIAENPYMSQNIGVQMFS